MIREGKMDSYKIGYSYSPSTGEFINAEIVYLEKATGTYPCADNVTFKKPPEPGEHQAVIFDAKAQDWKLVEDHRGQTWYQPDGSYGGVIEKLGAVTEILKEPPEPVPGSYIVWFDDDWKREPAEGFIQEGDKYREMTTEELLEAGKITLAEYNEHQRQMREATYQATTDKIGLMVLRGEATQEEWLAAIQAVKNKWPYKEA